jgi:hypothetical protein
MNYKKIFILLILQLLIASSVQARCNLELFRFGSSIAEIEKQITGHSIEMLGPEKMHREEIFYPGEEVCKGEKYFEGSPINFVFLYDKLVEIQAIRLSEKPVLVNWAESIYGEKKKKPRDFYAKTPSANWVWDNFNAVVFYSIAPDYEGVVESIVIQSRHHQRYFEKFAKEEEKLLQEELP